MNIRTKMNHFDNDKRIPKELAKNHYKLRGIDLKLLDNLLIFIENLDEILFETYLPEINTQEDMLNHFNWCFKKTCDNHIEKLPIEKYTNNECLKNELFDMYLIQLYEDFGDEKIPYAQPAFYKGLFSIEFEKYDEEYMTIKSMLDCYLNLFVYKK